MAESFNDFVAGWIGGAAGIIVGSPLDVLKARLQAPRAAGLETYPSLSSSSWGTLKQMVTTEGIGSLFKGVLAPVTGLAGLNAILFVSYGSLLRWMEQQRQTGSSQSTLTEVYLAGCGAGVACFLFSTPTDLIKIQAQVSRETKTSLQVAKEIYARNGLRGLYQGGWITIIRDAPSYGIYFWVYEGMKRILEVNSVDNVSGQGAWKLLLAGGMAGTISWASIYPIDVVKSRLQMQTTPAISSTHSQQISTSIPISTESTALPARSDRPYTSIKDCIVRSYRTEGISVFFRGLSPTIVRGFPVNAVTFWVYEVVMDMLSN
ncbi:mitochondrial carrier domain-containing protein [Radiomyces spectabilis]|uniref:mitochondrial carrier domain-containing protein n=1 Tax=Radiomyces spectabilis TaxID=64574 RepID=UPI00221ED4D9|nr:mitochondrial carrier domain-containing protein [Radiomyces spectabilis]KAI8374428.1 mitochondrial carrier domain-containing protein [Radiomyces spectabilis]